MPPTNLFGLGYGVGPAGYGYPSVGRWSPLSLGSSLAAWYKADAGCYTDAAMSCASASSQYASRTSEAALQAADVDFSFACYFKPASADRMFIAGKGDGNGTGEEWWLEYTALGAIYFGFGSASGNQGAQSSGTYSPGDPLFIVGTYTQSTGVGRVYVNGSLVGTSNALGAAHVSSSAPLSIGRDGQYNGLYTNGVVGRAGLWIGRALSAGDVTSLYNAGAGKFYADLTTAEKVSLVEYWNLCESSSTRVGSHAGLNLTPTNGPTVAAGPGEGLATNNSPVKRWESRYGTSHLTQSDIAKQPLWMSSGGANGTTSHVVFDGVDNVLSVSLNLGAAHLLALLLKRGGSASDYVCAGKASGNGAIISRYNADFEYFGAVPRVVITATDTVPTGIHSICAGGNASGVATRVDGAAGGTSATAAVDMDAGFFLGCYANVGTDYYGGSISEVVLSNAYSAAALASADSYLNARR